MTGGISLEHLFVQSGLNIFYQVETYEQLALDAVPLPLYPRIGERSLSQVIFEIKDAVEKIQQEVPNPILS